jgi:hypothetical protein
MKVGIPDGDALTVNMVMLVMILCRESISMFSVCKYADIS